MFSLALILLLSLLVAGRPIFNSTTSTLNGRDLIEPYELRILAVGDLGGDYGKTVKLLQHAGVIDQHNRWTGEVDYLINMGDIPDRGAGTIPLYGLFHDLRAQAKKSHRGAVVNLYGSHDLMNMEGDWRYVWQSDIDSVGSIAQRQRIFLDGFLADDLKNEFDVAARVPLHPDFGSLNTPFQPQGGPAARAAWAFMNGGIPPDARYDAFPSSLNSFGSNIANLLLSQRPAPMPIRSVNDEVPLPPLTTEQRSFLGSPKSPLLYRGWDTLPDGLVCQQVEQTLNAHGLSRMIVGSSMSSTVRTRCDNKIVLIPIGSNIGQGPIQAVSFQLLIEPTNVPGRYSQHDIITALDVQGGGEVIVEQISSLRLT